MFTESESHGAGAPQQTAENLLLPRQITCAMLLSQYGKATVSDQMLLTPPLAIVASWESASLPSVGVQQARRGVDWPADSMRRHHHDCHSPNRSLPVYRTPPCMLCGISSVSQKADVGLAWQTTRAQPRTANIYPAAYTCIRVLARQPQQARHVTIGIRIYATDIRLV